MPSQDYVGSVDTLEVEDRNKTFNDTPVASASSPWRGEYDTSELDPYLRTPGKELYLYPEPQVTPREERAEPQYADQYLRPEPHLRLEDLLKSHTKTAVQPKKPVYSLSRTDGAPQLQQLPPRLTGRIGLGHALPTKEQTAAYRAGKRKSKDPASLNPSRRHSPDDEGQAVLVTQLREMIHDEVSRAAKVQAEQNQEQMEEILSQYGPTERGEGSVTAHEDVKRSNELADSSMTYPPPLSGAHPASGYPRALSTATPPPPHSEEPDFPNPWSFIRYKLREPFAEFLGTFLLTTFGDGVNNQVFVSAMYDPSSPKGDVLSTSFGWGIGVAMGVWVAGGISGGMLNPAVTIALAVFRKFPWKKVPIYIIAQVAGCYMGSLFIYGTYVNPIRLVDPGQTEVTASLFATYPAKFLRQDGTRISGFWNEMYASAVLLIVVLAIGDSSNTPPPDGMAPIVLLWLITGIGATLGWQTAYAVNPARDLGPRLMLATVGYPSEILWSFDAGYWIRTPIVGTILGALIGAFTYDLLIYTGTESPLNTRWKLKKFWKKP